jgi:hypothetical protein
MNKRGAELQKGILYKQGGCNLISNEQLSRQNMLERAEKCIQDFSRKAERKRPPGRLRRMCGLY